MPKQIIYQVLPRLFGNQSTARKINGTIDENGCGKFNDFTPTALAEIKKLGITHVWYTGIIEHATQTDYSKFRIAKDHAGVVKGLAGSPYAIKDYYDVDPDLAVDVNNRMAEFEQLVERTHQADMKVIIDFVPNHVARQYHSDAKPEGVFDLGENDHSEWHFSPMNNFYYIPNQEFTPNFDVLGYTEYPAKATGNDVFSASPSQSDWYETVKLNYGVNYTEGMQKQFSPIPDTWLAMRDILLFWGSKNIDGFRCDMAEMVPVEFWGWVIPQIKTQYANILFIAEVYNPNEYRNYIANGKFDYLYDKVGLYDKLRGVTTRNHPARNISYCWQALGGIEDKMLNFLENHDEQRVASGFFAGNGMSAQPAMIVSATLTSGPIMIYFAQELGEIGMCYEGFSGLDGRTTIFDYWSLKNIQDWSNEGKFDGAKLTEEQKELRSFYQKLLNICLREKAISDGLMYDLVYANFENPMFNSHEQFAYFRKFKDDLLLIILNFHDAHIETELRIPFEAFQFLNLKENESYDLVNLLNEDIFYNNIKLSSNEMLKTQLPPWTGYIFKLTKSK